MRRFGLAVLLLLCMSDLLSAQACRKVKANFADSSRHDMVVSSTAITVLQPNTSRCGAVIYNCSTQDMRCADVADGAPTSMSGFLIQSGKTLVLGQEGQGQWQCIRTGSSDACASVAEALPQ